MPQTRLLVAAVLAALPLSAPQAVAVPGDFGVPCSYAGTIGWIPRGPEKHYDGVLAGGPWVVPGATSTTLTCTVETMERLIDSRSTTRPGTIAAVAATTSFDTIMWEDVYVCTYVASDGGPASRAGDCVLIQPGEGPTP